MHTWVLLLYKLAPDEPSARRVFIWRKLKRLGALALQDAVWVLPAAPWTIEQFQWLAVEIREMAGTALVWEARLSLDGQDDDLVRQFSAQADATYNAILADLANPDIEQGDVIVLAQRFQQAQAQDYFHSALGQQVRETLERIADRDGVNGKVSEEEEPEAGDRAP